MNDWLLSLRDELLKAVMEALFFAHKSRRKIKNVHPVTWEYRIQYTYDELFTVAFYLAGGLDRTW